MDARFHCLPNVLPVLLLGDSSYCLSQLYEMKYRSFLVIFSSERCLVWKECLQVGEHFLNILMSPKLILFAMVKSKLKYCPVNAYNIQMYWGQTMCKLLAHSGRPVNSFHAKTGSFQTNSTRFQYQGHHFFLSNVHMRKGIFWKIHLHRPIHSHFMAAQNFATSLQISSFWLFHFQRSPHHNFCC